MDVKEVLKNLAYENDLLDDQVRIFVTDTRLDVSRIKDYALMKGKEVLLRAIFRNCYGDAFTDSPMEFSGTLKEAMESCDRPALVALLNAVMKCLGLIDRTVHCHREEPEKCAEILVETLKTMDVKKIGIIGFQPAFVKAISEAFGKGNVMVSDRDPENVGRVKYGVTIMDSEKNEELIKNSDIVLATGSSFVNGTWDEILELSKKWEKRVIFYGTSIAGGAKLLGLERFCALGR